MTTAAFTKFATVTASTKRSPALSSGKRGAPATQIASLSCTPLDPVSAEIQQRIQRDTPLELLQTFADGNLDIVEGDVLVVGTKEYPIRSVGDWTFRGSKYLHLVVEELKK